MDNLLEQFLLEIHTDPRFRILEELVVKARPILPSYDFSDSKSVEKWKYESGLRDGFDLALSFFKMEVANERRK